MAFPEGATKGACGDVRNIRFINISSTSENGIFIGCNTPGKVSDILLQNVDLRLKKQTAYEGGVYDRRPCEGEGFLKSKVYGIMAENASRIIVRDFHVDANGFPGYESEFRFVNCKDTKFPKINF